MSDFWKEAGRFLLAGGSTTVLSYAIYLLLLFVLPYLSAYIIAYLAGIGWSYWVNSVFVFRRPMTLRGLLRFPLVYAVQLALGSLTVYIAIDRVGLPRWTGPLIATTVTLPATYLLARLLLVGRGHGAR